MKLVVGLGNPGDSYKNTPHNAGWMAIDELAKRYNATWRLENRFVALTSQINVKGENVSLMKPLTYMNLSGNSVGSFCQKKGIEPEDVLVIADELDFPAGMIKIKPFGSHNGHNGLRSIIESLGNNRFPRIRIGISPAVPQSKTMNGIDYVLSKLPPKLNEEFLVGVNIAADAAECVLAENVAKAMNLYNVKNRQE